MTSTRSLGIGLVGCGTIAYWKHLCALARMPGVRVAGLVDPDPEALARARRLVGAPAHPSIHALLADDTVDAVVVASPTALHAEHVRAACAAGRHVYVEKPPAHDLASLSTLRGAIRDEALVIAVGYNLRFHPACREARMRIASGSIGAVRAIVSEFTEPAPVTDMPAWKRRRSSGGGVLLDLATHHLDLYRWLLRDELAQVAADTRSATSEQDSAVVRATSRAGVDLCGYFAFTSSRSQCIAVHGDGAVLRLDLHSGRMNEERPRRRGYGVRRRSVAPGGAGAALQARKLLQPSWDPSHALALRAFVAAVAAPAQRHPDLATADDGIAAVQAVLDAEAGAGAAGTIP